MNSNTPRVRQGRSKLKNRRLDGKGKAGRNVTAKTAANQSASWARGKTITACLFITLFAVIALAFHSYIYYPFISDDSLISLRYSRMLLAGNGLVWNEGERVEGYSNLLWVLMVAALGALGTDLIDATRILGIGGMAAAIAAAAFVTRPTSGKEMVYSTLIVLLFSVSGPIAVWVVGGLEQPLVASLLAWAIVLTYKAVDDNSPGYRQLLLPGFLLALIAITRPDGVLFTAAVVLGLFLVRGLNRDTITLSLTLCSLPAFFFFGQFGFRLYYYGEWVPNPALVKVAFTKHRLFSGIKYLLDGMLHLWPLVITTVLIAGLSIKGFIPRRRIIILLVPLVLWSIYVVLIGGDIFPARRHLVPIVTLAILIAAEGRSLLNLAPRFARYSILTAAIALSSLAITQYHDKQNALAIEERWEWDGKPIGEMLKRAFSRERPLLAVSAAGSLPYFSELPSIDTLGLNDYYLPRHPPPNFGQGFLGHELGDGAYVLSRKPDLVSWGWPTGSDQPIFLSDRQMASMPEFHQNYSLVRFEAYDPHHVKSLIWVRKLSEKIGIQITGDTVFVPAYLFNGNPNSVVRINETGELYVPISKSNPAVLSKYAIRAGAWHLQAKGEGTIQIAVKDARQQRILALGSSNIQFTLKTAMAITIECLPLDGHAKLKHLTMTREVQ